MKSTDISHQTSDIRHQISDIQHPASGIKYFALRFFSKIVFICNLCFIAAVILRWVENMNKQKGDFSGAIKLQPLESTIVVLGYGAIIINFIFNLLLLVILVLKKEKKIEAWLIWFNFLILLVQVYYFFF
jgi:hypothetical protein